MDWQAFIDSPPQGLEPLAFHLRQAVAATQQAEHGLAEARQAVVVGEARVNHARGIVEGIKRAISCQLPASQGGLVPRRPGGEAGGSRSGAEGAGGPP
jgi:hypothetical protein